MDSTVYPSSRTQGGIVTVHIYRHKSRKRGFLLVCPWGGESSTNSEPPRSLNPPRSRRATRLMPFHASNTCEQHQTFCQTLWLCHCWWRLVGFFQSDAFFFSPRPPSVPKNRSQSVPPSRAGTGRGGAADVAVADYTTTGRLTDGLVNC